MHWCYSFYEVIIGKNTKECMTLVTEIKIEIFSWEMVKKCIFNFLNV